MIRQWLQHLHHSFVPGVLNEVCTFPPCACRVADYMPRHKRRDRRVRSRGAHMPGGAGTYSCRILRRHRTWKVLADPLTATTIIVEIQLKSVSENPEVWYSLLSWRIKDS